MKIKKRERDLTACTGERGRGGMSGASASQEEMEPLEFSRIGSRAGLSLCILSAHSFISSSEFCSPATRRCLNNSGLQIKIIIIIIIFFSSLPHRRRGENSLAVLFPASPM